MAVALAAGFATARRAFVPSENGKGGRRAGDITSPGGL